MTWLESPRPCDGVGRPAWCGAATFGVATPGCSRGGLVQITAWGEPCDVSIEAGQPKDGAGKRGVDGAQGASDLPSRIRRALAHRDRAELALLNPIVLALAKSEVSLSEIESLDAEQALWLVAARAQQRGELGTGAFVMSLGR